MSESDSNKVSKMRLLVGFVSGVLTVVIVTAVLCRTGRLHFGGIARQEHPTPAPTPEPTGTEPPPKIASTFDSVIRPLLDAKCARCHGEKKQKAGLSLANEETILVGGKHGPAIDRAAPEKSPMLARIELALEEDKHMPPEDQDQLAPAELAALRRWIAAGAPFDGVVAGIDALPLAADAPPDVKPGPTSSRAFADPAALEALRQALVHVQPVSEGSPLLWVDFAAAAKSFDDAKVRALLAPLREQLSDLSLARCPVGDETLALLADFESLHRLDVRATAVTDRGVAALATHAKLAEIVLSQDALSDASVESLIAMPALESAHVWRSGISAEAIAHLRAARPNLRVDDGAAAPSAALETETRIELTKAPAAVASSTAAPSLVPVNAKCPVTGAPVNLKYSVVHEGRVIGFCCPNCPKEFWADPAKFADKLQ